MLNNSDVKYIRTPNLAIAKIVSSEYYFNRSYDRSYATHCNPIITFNTKSKSIEAELNHSQVDRICSDSYKKGNKIIVIYDKSNPHNVSSLQEIFAILIIVPLSIIIIIKLLDVIYRKQLKN